MILDRLQQDVVIGDGGAIFELERRGYVSAGPFTPEAVVEFPQAVRGMQIDFARAGAEVLQACTYYAHKEKLEQAGVADRLEEINREAVRIARGVAAEYGCLVAGNLANTWVYDPHDPASHDRTRAQFEEQIAGQLAGGDVDFFIAETIEYTGEARLAIEAIHAAGKPAMITLGFKYADRTLDDMALEDAFRGLEDAGAEILGINCFRGPAMMLPLGARLRAAVRCYTALQPVAYRGDEERPYFQALRFAGKPAFPLALDPFVLTRGEMADYAVRARELGINFIGSCCGSGPHHVRAMAEALGRQPPASRWSPRLHLHTIIGDATHIRERDQRILRDQRGDD